MGHSLIAFAMTFLMQCSLDTEDSGSMKLPLVLWHWKAMICQSLQERYSLANGSGNKFLTYIEL